MKVSVLGLGPSLRHYSPDGSVTVGVNDVFKFHPVDYLVVVDRPRKFSPDRLHTICKSTPQKFFTHLYNDWRLLVPNLQELKFAKYRGPHNLKTNDRICYSNNSTFVACVVAYKLGAKEIVVYGCDLQTHPAFVGPSLKIALRDFKTLYKELSAIGVKMYCASNESRLSEFMPVKFRSNPEPQ